MNTRPPNGEGQKPAFAGQTRAPEQKLNVAFDVVTVAEGLVNPWGLAFLPDGKMLVTEKPGRLRVVSADGKQLSEPVAGLPAVDARGQGGLLDVALDPAFATNQLIYWSYAEPRDGGANNTAVARGRFVDGAAPRVENVQVIFHQAPSLASPLHFGGRLVFGARRHAVRHDGRPVDHRGPHAGAEAWTACSARSSASTPTARCRRTIRSSARTGVRPEIWSIGHRNMQAATLHPATGELWEVEHGTRGGDELNIARKGKDYGWPTIAYGIEYQGGPITGGIQQKDGMEQPRYYWDPVIAPSGMVFYTGTAVPGVAEQPVHRRDGQQEPRAAHAEGRQSCGEERLLQDLQPQRERIRDVRQGPDGALYLLTDSAKGRILKIVPKP